MVLNVLMPLSDHVILPMCNHVLPAPYHHAIMCSQQVAHLEEGGEGGLQGADGVGPRRAGGQAHLQNWSHTQGFIVFRIIEYYTLLLFLQTSHIGMSFTTHQDTVVGEDFHHGHRVLAVLHVRELKEQQLETWAG